MSSKKIIVGMSGGVDSTVAAYLLKKEGYEVCGLFLKLFENDKTEESIRDLEKIAQKLEIEIIVKDYTKLFKETVIGYFVGEYENGRTPNPCVECNRKIKWSLLLEEAKERGAQEIATGHYAKIVHLPNGRLTIAEGQDLLKDQSYFLYVLSQEVLQKIRFPLADLSKEMVREIAVQEGLPVAIKKDSQDICFIQGRYQDILKEQLGAPEEGHFVDKEGNILGVHTGIVNYTIGQRKGTGLAMGEKKYIIHIRKDTNEVVLGENEDLLKDKLIARALHFLAFESLGAEMEVWVKIRYSRKKEKGVIRMLGVDRLECKFENPLRAITPGQSAVFYDDDGCLIGGGIIE